MQGCLCTLSGVKTVAGRLQNSRKTTKNLVPEAAAVVAHKEASRIAAKESTTLQRVLGVQCSHFGDSLEPRMAENKDRHEDILGHALCAS